MWIGTPSLPAGFGYELSSREVRELARERGARLAPEPAHHVDVLVGARAAPLERDAERVELLAQPADADAEVDPAARQAVERRDLLREHERVALRKDQDAGRRAGSSSVAAATNASQISGSVIATCSPPGILPSGEYGYGDE